MCLRHVALRAPVAFRRVAGPVADVFAHAPPCRHVFSPNRLLDACVRLPGRCGFAHPGNPRRVYIRPGLGAPPVLVLDHTVPPVHSCAPHPRLAVPEPGMLPLSWRAARVLPPVRSRPALLPPHARRGRAPADRFGCMVGGARRRMAVVAAIRGRFKSRITGGGEPGPGKPVSQGHIFGAG